MAILLLSSLMKLRKDPEENINGSQPSCAEKKKSSD